MVHEGCIVHGRVSVLACTCCTCDSYRVLVPIHRKQLHACTVVLVVLHITEITVRL